MAILNGNNFRLYLDGEVVEGELSSDLSMTNNIIEAVRSDTGDFVDYIDGVKSGSFTFENLSPLGNIDIGDEYLVRFGLEEQGYEANAVIESIDIQAVSDELSTFSGTARVNGVLRLYDDRDDDFLLLETGDFFLLEDGCKLVIEIPDI